MYTKWAERRGFTVELIEEAAGEIAGIRSGIIKVEGKRFKFLVTCDRRICTWMVEDRNRSPQIS
jgi:protein subunit release factor B